MLANRYASEEMRQTWSAENKIIAERRLWLAVLTAQRDLGVDFGGDDPTAVIAAYEAVLENVDLARIAEREQITRHDVKARIEEFNALAGFQHVHKAMTSRDLTENVEQLQIISSLKIIRNRGGRDSRPARPAGNGSRRTRHGRPLAQRRRAGHHVGEALRDRSERAAGGLPAAGGVDRPVPDAWHQGAGRNELGHAGPGG